MMRDGFAVLDDVGDDVLAEIVARMRVGGVAAHLVDQEPRVEGVDAHARERLVGIAGNMRRVRRLLHEVDDDVVLIDMHHAEAGRFPHRDFERGDGDVGILLDMLLEHELHVHLVDVVAGQNDHVFRIVGLDDVDVLVDGVRGAGVPTCAGDALARRQDVEALVAHRLQEVPAALQVADQAVRLVLRGDREAADAGIQRVGEREVDDARLAAEVDRGLGPPVGELHEARAAAAGEHVRHGRAGEGGGEVGAGHGFSLSAAPRVMGPRARARACRAAAR